MTGHPETPATPAPRDGATRQVPLLGRTLLVLAVAVVGVGLVVVLYDRGWLPVAGIFVAMIVGPMVVHLRRVQLARRLQRLRRRLDEQLETLGSADLGPRATQARRLLAAGDDVGAARAVESLLHARETDDSADATWRPQAAQVAATTAELRRTRGRVDAQRRRR